jgi:hypothetical protein
MRRLPFAILLFALPSLAQEVADAGTADAGEVSVELTKVEVKPLTPPIPEGVGRHYSYVWDVASPPSGDADVQIWIGPKWGRPEVYSAVDARAGVLIGLPRGYAVGFFIDATPASTGYGEAISFEGRGTLHLQDGWRITKGLHWGSQVEVSSGPNAMSLWLMLGLQADIGPLHIGLNADGYLQSPWPEPNLALDVTRLRQSLGLSYQLPNGFSIALELQNRLAWHKNDYVGEAFFIGPTVAYRGSTWWFNVSLFPQVAAMKADRYRGVGDPLELRDNVRFETRVALGVVAR